MIIENTVPIMEYLDFTNVQDAMDHLNSNEDQINSRIVEAIQYALYWKLPEVKLYTIILKGEEEYSMILNRKEYCICLERALEFYEEIEYYEFCRYVKVLIDIEKGLSDFNDADSIIKS